MGKNGACRDRKYYQQRTAYILKRYGVSDLVSEGKVDLQKCFTSKNICQMQTPSHAMRDLGSGRLQDSYLPCCNVSLFIVLYIHISNY